MAQGEDAYQGDEGYDYSGAGNGGSGGSGGNDYSEYDIDQRQMVIVAVLFGIMMAPALAALVGCCCARQRPGEMDVPVQDFNCFCCSNSSLAKIRRLCVAVGAFSLMMLLLTGPSPLMLLFSAVCMVTIWLSVKVYRASTEASFVHSNWVLRAPHYHKLLLFCAVVELGHLVIGVLALFLQTPICVMDICMLSRGDCCGVSAFLLPGLATMAGLTIGLGITLSDVSVRLQQAASAQVQSPDMSFYHVAPATSDHPLVIPVDPNQGLLGPKPHSSV